MKYFNELKKSMDYISQKRNTIFIGQAVEVAGTAMSNTLINVKKNKKLEMPVSEEMQMGITTGLMMTGYTPVSIFPRWNFLLLAMNQLVNHLDKFNIMTNGKYKSKAIIRTGIGSKRPLHPQCQHVVRLDKPDKIFIEYKKAIDAKNNKSTILVEYGDYYNEK